MIKFRTDGKVPIYGLGVSRGNIDRLTNGQPIVVNLQDIGGPPGQVVIMFGETERAIFDELKSLDLIAPGIEFIEPARGVNEIVRIKRPKR